MTYPAVQLDTYSGSCRNFFANYIFPVLPTDDAICAWNETLLAYIGKSPRLFIVRNNRQHRLRGHLYNSFGNNFVCSDNEPALWMFMECYLRRHAIDYEQLLKDQLFPIAYCFKTAERTSAFWKTTGRVHDEFSSGGWKHAHILPCAKDCAEAPLAIRMLRLLNSFNHFPFPSSRHFSMSKAWEEDKKVLELVIYMFAHELGGARRRRTFQEFITLAGGKIPPVPPHDITIRFERRSRTDRPFLDLRRFKGKADLKNAPSTDESFYSIAKVSKRDAIPFGSFLERLDSWLAHTDEETICNGSANYNQQDWLWTRYGSNLLYLNADSTREGVKQFCTAYRLVQKLQVVRNADTRKKPSERTVNKVVVLGCSEISGFYLYSDEHFEKPQMLLKH